MTNFNRTIFLEPLDLRVDDDKVPTLEGGDEDPPMQADIIIDGGKNK